MKPVFVKASGIFLGVLAAVLVWLLAAAASLATAGGPNPLHLRAPHPVDASSASAIVVTVILTAALLCAAVVVALLQRSADRRSTPAEVTSLDAPREQEHKAA